MTVDDVNALIPELDVVFQRLIALRREIAARANEIERLGYDPATSKRKDLPPEILERRDLLDQSVVAFEREIDRIGALGGILQDLDLGLVDFHHTIDGDSVLLCWQFGEPAVTHFHPLDARPGVRSPLPDCGEAPLPH